ncbi:hypothetical protein MLD38_021952 [Melastoma candidum]|uniref:Uncharacterized protein n=1 Tax=Melastoma candidum TaxID=119954 RepID=A0ACB9QQU0_9MYRT|nr:hypothetical protein MLD38_021952 [Melastoma candidum]
MSGGRRDAIKVVLIDTQYVQTDASSFKSVVQKLTGKDSEVPNSPNPSGDHRASRTGGRKGTRLSGSSSEVEPPTDGTGILTPVALERLIKEMPRIEDLDYLWTG